MAKIEDSIYNMTKRRKEVLRNRGYQYEGQIMSNVLSSEMLEKPEVVEFNENAIEPILKYTTRYIKDLKKFYGFTIDKDFYDFN